MLHSLRFSVRVLGSPLFVLAFLCLLCAATDAQKLGRKYFEDERNGFRLKPLDEFSILPPRPDEEARGIVVKMSGKELYVMTEAGTGVNDSPNLEILCFRGEVQEQEGENRSRSAKRRSVDSYLRRKYRGLDLDNPLVDEMKKVKKLRARHRRFEARNAGGQKLVHLLDVWSFELLDADVHLIYRIAEKKAKKYLKVFEKSAKSFNEIPRTSRSGKGDDLVSYEAKLAFHEEEAARIPGWRAIPVKSEKYIIKTSSDNKKFINEVIQRLEASRLLYEKDFPPPASFDHVSIVRICGSEQEFHKYGNTRRGVAGWFNPGSTELVLYDAVSLDRNMTYAVMSHEAFHQYCHFLFEQSEAHRWFDEGHGDYYGAARFSGRKAEITKKMPAGLDRLSVIKEMVRSKTYVSVEEHIHFSHPQWQNQGPTNVSCYAQSWSIIYMLRQGTLGKLNKKVWKPEYARIIPAYVETLSKGFSKAYAEILAERAKRAKKEKREMSDEEKKVGRQSLDPNQKQEIWAAALQASWGTVDLAEFERDWVRFVEDVL